MFLRLIGSVILVLSAMIFFSCGPVVFDHGLILPKYGVSFFNDLPPNAIYMHPFDFSKFISGYPQYKQGMQFDYITHDELGELPGCFSDDGRYVSYVYGESKYNPDSLRGTLWIIDLQTKEKKQITQNDGVRVYHIHDWCSQTNKIVFTGYFQDKKKRKQEGNLYTVDLNTGEIEQLTHYSENFVAMHPAWSYDGKYIAFALNSAEEKQYEIMLMNYATRKIVGLTKTPDVVEIFPMWNFEGRYLYYLSRKKRTDKMLILRSGFDTDSAELWRIDMNKSELNPVLYIPRKNIIKNYEKHKEFYSGVGHDREDSTRKYSYINFSHPTMAGNGEHLLSYPFDLVFFDLLTEVHIQYEYHFLPANGFAKLSPTGDKFVYTSFRKNLSTDKMGHPDLWIVDISELIEKFKSREWSTQWLYNGENQYLWEGVDKKPSKME